MYLRRELFYILVARFIYREDYSSVEPYVSINNHYMICYPVIIRKLEKTKPL